MGEEVVVVDVEMELTQGMKASRGRNVFTPSAGLTRCSVRSPQGGGQRRSPQRCNTRKHQRHHCEEKILIIDSEVILIG